MTEFPPPADQPDPAVPAKRGAFTRFLDGVEWLGNLLPHPVTLFALLALGIVLLSGIFGALGVAVTDPRPQGAPGVTKASVRDLWAHADLGVFDGAYPAKGSTRSVAAHATVLLRLTPA